MEASTTASTGVKIVASPTLAQYDALAADVTWLDKTNSALVVNGTEFAILKGLMHGAHLSATAASIAAELGFRPTMAFDEGIRDLVAWWQAETAPAVLEARS